ncbi:MAG: pullulanase [Ignavibacteriales bacterium]|nr:pullulanase [Ignavibacteriales bacterium]
MKEQYKVFAFIAIFLLFPKINSEGYKLYISDDKEAIIDSSKYKFSQHQLNTIYSSKELGSIVSDNSTTFRIFAPSAEQIILKTFVNVSDTISTDYNMTKDENGVWEVKINIDLTNYFYGYQVFSEDDISRKNNPPLCVDPYAKAVATYADYLNPRKSIVYNESYDWENDNWIQKDWRDLIIYEMHIRDLTAHKTSGSNFPGTYKGLVEENITGGINYIKSLGVNTVELLPSQEYGYCEIPFKDSLAGKYNTWNPYERNHWGYMTSNFFAPAGYYAENIGVLKRGNWIGTKGEQIKQFKDMVKAFHKNKIAVIMDVVYNHLSEYEVGNLKEIDKNYYFRLDDKGNFIAESYCGNDLKTERPMLRRLIVESIIYWMKEYHVDGFRFDLGKLIDWETIEAIIREARKINPDVVFVCEPWGGGYDPMGFSLREWGSWNDQIRNGIKGENPFNGLGWIFGKWFGNNNFDRIKSYVRGTLINEEHGLFQEPEHSVNYLESHDGYTLGDFIRLGLGKIKKDEVITNINKNVHLTQEELKLHKLAALFLFTSQGITMIHEGQEFGRSKVIELNDYVEDTEVGTIDHNTYNKDNNTNYLNFIHAELNKDLVNYYKGLIKLRKLHKIFSKANYDDYFFQNFKKNEFALAYQVKYSNKHYIVVFNADRNQELNFELPSGWWEILADENMVLPDIIKSISGSIVISPSSGIVLKEK